jgi:WD domain, G-beta repeat
MSSLLVSILVCASSAGQADSLPPGAVGRLGTARLRSGDPINAVAFAPDGNTLATASNHTVRIWDVTTRRLLRELAHSDMACSVAFSPDGRLIASGGGGEGGETERDRSILIWETASGKLRQSFRNRQDMANIRSLSFSPDGKFLGWGGGCWDAAPRFFDLTWDEVVPWLAAERTGVSVVVFASRGRTLATADEQMLIRVRDWPEGQERFCLRGHEAAIQAAAFSPDALSLASGDEAGEIWLWTVATGKTAKRVASPAGVRAAVFSPDGRFLVTGESAGVVRMWDAATLKMYGRFEGHNAAVTALSVSPDGKLLASSSCDGTVILWRLGSVPSLAEPSLLPTELAAAWCSLASSNPIEGSRAVGLLAAAPRQSVPWLEEQLGQMTQPSEGQVRLWIADLDSRRFLVRRKAHEDLATWGHLVAPSLREAIQGRPTLEMRRRVEELLNLAATQEHCPAQVRLKRALRILEQAGTPEAQRVLGRFAAAGIPGAKSALGRVKRR